MRKLYADLVTDDGTVIIMYLVWLRLGGVPSSQAMVEMYAPDGSRRVVHGLSPRYEPARLPDGGYKYRMVCPDGRALTMVHSGPADEHLPRIAVAPHLSWRVSVAGTRATFTQNGETLKGTGYADWVELNRPPRMVGLKTLQWGRVHLPDRTVVFNAVDLGKNRWTQVSDWNGTGLVLSDGEPAQTADGVRISAPRGPVRLKPMRVLHQGDAIDEQRIPNPVIRFAGRLANGPSSETRWVSRAVAEGGAAGLAVHEMVRFGGVR